MAVGQADARGAGSRQINDLTGDGAPSLTGNADWCVRCINVSAH